MTKRSRRLDHQLRAAAALEINPGPVMGLLAEVIDDLREECDDLPTQFEADMILAGELAHRLDAAIQLGDPILELFDGLILWFVALGAIGIWRSVARSERLRGSKLDRLRDRLERRGPRMAARARKRLERRISRLEG